MNILVMSASPYILAKSGKIASSILLDLKSKGHKVASIAFDHDPNSFAPNDNGDFKFEKNGQEICDIFPCPRPFPQDPSHSLVLSYEIMKAFAPDILVTVGNVNEIGFVSNIKKLYPHLFKWVAILLLESAPVDERNKNTINLCDQVVCLSKWAYDGLISIGAPNAKYIPYGIHEDFFNHELQDQKEGHFRLISTAKNSTSCNPMALFEGLSILDSDIKNNIELYLHSNVNDPGEYDYDMMSNRYKIDKYVKYPSRYVSIFDGYSNSELVSEYCNSHVFVDCSVRSATGISMLESMACGCIPLVVGVGTIGEISENIINVRKFVIDGVPYIADSGERYQIASPASIAKNVVELYQVWKKDRYRWNKIRKECKSLADKVTESSFLEKINALIETTRKSENKLKIELIQEGISVN